MSGPAQRRFYIRRWFQLIGGGPMTMTVAEVVTSMSTLALSIVSAAIIGTILVAGVVIRYARSFLTRITGRGA